MAEQIFPGIPDVAGKYASTDSQLRDILIAMKVTLQLMQDTTVADLNQLLALMEGRLAFPSGGSTKIGYDGDTSYISISATGDLIYVGAAGLCYGSLYAHDASINIDISGVGQGVPVKVTGLTTGLLNNVSINSDAFNVDNIGVYKVDWQMTGDSAGTGKVYDMHIYINGVEQEDGSSHRGFGSVGSLGSFSGTAILDVTDIGHDIDLRISEPGGGSGTDIDIDDVNFNVVQIGGHK